MRVSLQGLSVTREAQLRTDVMRKHDQHLLHNPMNVQADKYFGCRRVVPAMVINSGDAIAWLATSKLLGLRLYEVSLPTSSFVHQTAALQPL